MTLLAFLALAPQEAPVDFGREVLPILTTLCFDCHGPDAAARQADLRLDVRDEALFVIEPGAPDESALLLRTAHERVERRMPPPEYGKSATAEEVEVLRRWIEEGAEYTDHWAFTAPELAPPPPAAADPWCVDPLDGIVLEKLRVLGLEPSPAADRATWRRRVSFAITGLPPQVAAPDAFEGESDEAFVDALLASDARAEHRTREWLDLARYADTNGYQNDFRRDQWPWRDWVLRAFRDNLPYDDFVAWQTAGDLMPDATRDQILATGFNRNHRMVTEAGSLDEEWRVENVADRTETTGTAFLGLTIGCARCHDHRYDPISQEEYYELYAFFDQVDEKGVYQETRGNVPPLIEVPAPDHEELLAEADEAIRAAEEQLEATEAIAESRFTEWCGLPERRPSRPADPVLWLSGSPAIRLDGDEAAAPDLGTAISFEQDRPFTVSVWIRPESHGAVYSRMADDNTYRGTDLVLLDDMRPAVHLIHSWRQNAIKVIGRRPLERSRWQHLAVVYDGSKKASGVRLYLDGEAQELEVEVDQLDGSIVTERSLRIGQRRFAGALTGDVKDFRVDARALSYANLYALTDIRVRREARVGDRTAATHLWSAWFDEVGKEAREELRAAERERDRLAADLPTAMVLRDRTVEQGRRTTRVLDRGRYDRPTGDALVPDVPEALGALPDGIPRNRLGLARWLIDPANPLTARVAANRVWASFFGTGLVATPEDFGVRGARPTHEALLDHLAVSLVESGWDLAALERRIALSATYRQSSRTSAELRERDPENRLIVRGPRQRLDAEALRDQALAVSGLLRPRFGGPSVKPYQPDGLWKELAGGAGQGAYVPSEGDDLYRRSVYTYRKRTVPHPTLTTFDAPAFELCTARRPRTNTPLQALALWNDPTYVEAARHLAADMRDAESERAGLALGIRCVLVREARDAELDVLAEALAHHRESFAGDPAAAREHLAVGASAPAELADEEAIEWAAWSLVASTLLQLDEAVAPR